MRLFWAIAIVCVNLLGITAAHAEKRVALVVGNSDYGHVGRLPNPVNDATAMAVLFKSAGFDKVELHNNLGIADMRRAVREFTDTARDSDIAVIYFAGHGIEIDGINYLIPTDAALENDFDVEDEAFALDRALRAIEPARRLRLIILDACRSNPFVGRMKRSSRAIGRGFTRPEPATPDTLVAFAAKAGSTAADGTGEHSPFTAALLKHIATPGLDIRLALGDVRDTVMATTSPRQEPFVYGSLGGRTIAIVEGRPTAAGDPAERAWAAVRDSTRVADFEAFASSYPGTFYARLAQNRIEELKKAQAAAAPSASAQSTGFLAPSSATSQVAAAAPPVVPAVPPADPCAGPVTVSFAPRCAAPLTAAQERALKPKDVFRECEKCPEMVVVPAGRFTMGAPQNEKDRYAEEGPQHAVTIGRAFAVGRLHVTAGEFAAFVAETKYDAGSKCYVWTGKWEERDGASWRNPGFAQEDTHPAVCLSLNDAKAYVEWLAKKTGKPYRLLSEAEWEYAARARTSPGNYPRFWFGNNEKDLCRYGNGADQTARDTVEGAKGWTVAPCDDGYAYTSPAGHFPANDFGLHDMFGNVWQWMADCYNDSYKGAPADGSVWAAGDCSSRVARGGAWGGYPGFLRSAYRGRVPAYSRFSNGGSRVGRMLITPEP